MSEPPSTRLRLDEEPNHNGEEGQTDDPKLEKCLKLVFGEDDVQDKAFQPEFAHQIFEDKDAERLEGADVTLRFELGSWALTGLATANPESEQDKFAIERLNQAKCVEPLFKDREVLTLPKGRVVWNNEEGFELRYIDSLDDTSKRLLSRGLAMATFYIERASQVDVNDPSWKLLLCVKHQDDKETLVGFTSVFEFTKPMSDTKSLRVCVMLVIPPFQRRRLGEDMLRAVYHEAQSSQNVAEVTVEDPCAAFQKMRNRVDVKECAKINGLYFHWDVSQFEKMPSVLPAKEVKRAQDLIKISENQLQFCFEAAWLRKLQETGQTDEESEAKKRFRLSIKKRTEKRPGDRIIPDKQKFPSEFKATLQSEYLLELQALEDAIKQLNKQ